MTNRKKMALAGLLVLVMVGSAVMGTLAYLTDSAHLDNTFLVGAFTPPKDPKPDPDKPDPTEPDPTPTDPAVFGDPTTFIYEPYWNANGNDAYTNTARTVAPDNHRLLAGETTVKDPYIGIGKESESGYVLACITNPMGSNVYFSLGEGWAPVENMVDEVTISDANGKPASDTETGTKYYSAGLFKWVGTNTDGNLAALTPADSDSDGVKEDAWTTHPVFTNVYTAKNGLDAIKAMEKANQKMTVWAYIHQTEGHATEGATEVTEANTATVVAAATTWAKTNDANHPNYTPATGA